MTRTLCLKAKVARSGQETCVCQHPVAQLQESLGSTSRSQLSAIC